MTGLLMKRGKLETDTYTGRRPCEDNGREWSDVSTCQGMPKIASKVPEARGETWNSLSHGPHRKQPCQYFDFRLLVCRTVR